MGIGPLELSGAIGRVQDFAIMRQGEDNKAAAAQANISQNVKKESDERTTTVKQSDGVLEDNRKFDAKDKGKNEYYGDGGRRREHETVGDGHVTVKGSTSTFDIRI